MVGQAKLHARVAQCGNEVGSLRWARVTTIIGPIGPLFSVWLIKSVMECSLYLVPAVTDSYALGALRNWVKEQRQPLTCHPRDPQAICTGRVYSPFAEQAAWRLPANGLPASLKAALVGRLAATSSGPVVIRRGCSQPD